MKILFSVFLLTLLASCTVGLEQKTETNNGVTPTTITTEDALPSPSMPIWTGVLEESSIDSISLSWVMDTVFTYLDSENKSYASGTFREIISRYPHTVVYFYPKDGTPNCTIQALDFSMMLTDFRAKGYNVIWVSKDGLDSHKVFAERNELKIELLQDANGDLLKAFGAEGPLQTYGNGDELSDIIRSTYIIDSTGTPSHAYRDIVAMGHARRIYEVATGEEYTK